MVKTDDCMATSYRWKLHFKERCEPPTDTAAWVKVHLRRWRKGPQSLPSGGDTEADDEAEEFVEYSQKAEDGVLRSLVTRMGNRQAAKDRSSQRQDAKEWVLARNRNDFSMNDRQTCMCHF